MKLRTRNAAGGPRRSESLGKTKKYCLFHLVNYQDTAVRFLKTGMAVSFFDRNIIYP